MSFIRLVDNLSEDKLEWEKFHLENMRVRSGWSFFNDFWGVIVHCQAEITRINDGWCLVTGEKSKGVQ